MTLIDAYSSVAFAKVYDTKTPVTAADTLNDQVLPFFEEHDIPGLRVLTDRGTEYCGRDNRHPYQIFLGLNEIDHSRIKASIHRLTASANAFIKPVSTSFTRSPSGQRFTGTWRRCRPTWMTS